MLDSRVYKTCFGLRQENFLPTITNLGSKIQAMLSEFDTKYWKNEIFEKTNLNKIKNKNDFDKIKSSQKQNK